MSDATPNGTETRRPQAGDPLTALMIQTGRLDGAACEIEWIRLIE